MAAIVDRHYEVLILLAGAAVERQELVPFQRRLHAHQIHLLSAFSTSRCRHRRHIRLPKPTTKAAIAVKPIIPINRAHRGAWWRSRMLGYPVIRITVPTPTPNVLATFLIPTPFARIERIAAALGTQWFILLGAFARPPRSGFVSALRHRHCE